MSLTSKILDKTDFQSVNDHIHHREQNRFDIVALKKQRRLEIGPDIVFHFENKDTIRFQIQEMLYIEKGGDQQIEEELEAYTPLLPQGNNLTATMMIEIPDSAQRQKQLLQLGHIEDTITMNIAGEDVAATSIDDAERTTLAGKTSAVHFLNFSLNEKQRELFKQISTLVSIKIAHVAYSFKVDLPKELQITLAQDLE